MIVREESFRMKKVLLAGGTGYLGSFIAKALQERSFAIRAIARHTASLKEKGVLLEKVVKAELTQPETIKGCCSQIDVVISTVGITRQKDGLTYMDVDYQANMNLLREAQKCGVGKFIYVSVLNGENLRHLKICDAKEKFVDRLKASGLDYCVVRPNGFFSDMVEFLKMAEKGRVYLFGNGQLKVNPIHGEDLATVCVDAIAGKDQEIRVGGPETLTHNEIAAIAFEVLGKKPKVTYIPDWVRVAILKLVRNLTRSQTYGPIEFFLTAMAIDMFAPEYGECTIKDYFSNLKYKHP
jgi:uncharacterized protein YbjT (DUF2867 family)